MPTFWSISLPNKVSRAVQVCLEWMQTSRCARMRALSASGSMHCVHEKRLCQQFNTLRRRTRGPRTRFLCWISWYDLADKTIKETCGRCTWCTSLYTRICHYIWRAESKPFIPRPMSRIMSPSQQDVEPKTSRFRVRCHLSANPLPPHPSRWSALPSRSSYYFVVFVVVAATVRIVLNSCLLERQRQREGREGVRGREIEIETETERDRETETDYRWCIHQQLMRDVLWRKCCPDLFPDLKIAKLH